jgi:cytochrome c-type biogenesis protein
MTLGMPVLAEIALSPVGLSVAFAAGVVSFLSPCVWPLVPAYLSYVSGVSFDALGEQTRRVVTATAAFVLGFGAVFTALGAGAGLVGDVLTEHRRPLEIVSGILVVAMGAVLAGLGGRLLQQDRRLHAARRPAGPIGAVVAGAGFGIGWTPCVGPTLAAILALAGRSGHAADGAVLLAVYSLGLGVPFLLSGLLFTRGLARLSPLRRHTPLLVRGSGLVLMALGVLLALGQMTALTNELASAFPALV